MVSALSRGHPRRKPGQVEMSGRNPGGTRAPGGLWGNVGSAHPHPGSLEPWLPSFRLPLFLCVKTWVSRRACWPEPGCLFRVTLHFSAHIHFESLSRVLHPANNFPNNGGGGVSFQAPACIILPHTLLFPSSLQRLQTGIFQFIGYT